MTSGWTLIKHSLIFIFASFGPESFAFIGATFTKGGLQPLLSVTKGNLRPLKPLLSLLSLLSFRQPVPIMARILIGVWVLIHFYLMTVLFSRIVITICRIFKERPWILSKLVEIHNTYGIPILILVKITLIYILLTKWV